MFFVVGHFWDDVEPLWRAALVGLAVLGALLVLFSRPRRQAKPAPDPLVGIVEPVLADETRRPWNPTTLPWPPTGATSKWVLLIPAADCHLAEMVPLARELEKRDVLTRLAIGDSPWECTWRGLHWYPDKALASHYPLVSPDDPTGQWT